jgi:hypothetical protein
VTVTPEGMSREPLNPDNTLMVEGWHVNVGAGAFTFDGQTVTDTRIVATMEMFGVRLRDSKPMSVTLVVPVEDVDRLITRLQTAYNTGMPLHQVEEGLHDGT